MTDPNEDVISAKVAYEGPTGWISTAYLDTELGNDRYAGTDKYTDEPVIVRLVGSKYVLETATTRSVWVNGQYIGQDASEPDTI